MFSYFFDNIDDNYPFFFEYSDLCKDLEISFDTKEKETSLSNIQNNNSNFYNWDSSNYDIQQYQFILEEDYKILKDEEAINKQDKNEDNINSNTLNNNENINNLQNVINSTPQIIVNKQTSRGENNRKKSMRKFNDNLYNFISPLFSELGLKIQKFYIKQLYGKNKDENRIFIEKTIKNLIIESVPKRIPKNGNKMINKIIIDELYNIEEIDEEKSLVKSLLIALLEKTVEEMYNKYILDDKKIGNFNLEDYEKKYKCYFKTFKEDHEKFDNIDERQKYENNAKNLIKDIKDKKGDFIGRPNARGRKKKNNY